MMQKRPPRALLLSGMAALALVFAAGCGAAEQTLPKQLGELRSEILRLRADHAALQARLDAIERGPAGIAGASPRPTDRPTLETVRLSPEAAEAPSFEGESEQDDEGAAPTVLRSTPGGGVVEEPRRPESGVAPPPAAKKTKRSSPR